MIEKAHMFEKSPGRIGRIIRSDRFREVIEALRSEGVSILFERPKTAGKKLGDKIAFGEEHEKYK